MLTRRELGADNCRKYVFVGLDDDDNCLLIHQGKKIDRSENRIEDVLHVTWMGIR